MAEKEQLSILKQGVGVWNSWRKERPNVEIDLRKAELSGLNLDGVNFAGADLHSAKLMKTSLVKAELENAHLRDTKMQGADLSRAHLYKAQLMGGEFHARPVEGGWVKPIQFDLDCVPRGKSRWCESERCENDLDCFRGCTFESCNP